MRHDGVLTLPTAPRVSEAPGSVPTQFALPPLTRALTWAVAFYLTVAVSKINDLVPATAVLRPAKILALVVLIAALSSPLRERLRVAMGTTTAKAVGVIAIMMVASVPFSVWRSHSVAFFAGQGVQTFFLFVFAAAAFTDRRAVPVLVWAWMLSTGLGALRMLLPGAPMEVGRVMMSRAFDPNESAALLVCTLPFAAWLATRGTVARIAALGFVGAAILAIVKSGSRGGLIGLAFMGLAMLWVSPPRKRIAYLLAAIVGGAVVLATANEDLRTRMASIFSHDDAEVDYNFTDRDGRIQIWQRGIGYMVSHPIVGIGVDGFETAELTISGKENVGYGIRGSAAHNSFVQIGAELGVIGLLAFVTAVSSAAVGLWRARRRAVLQSRAERTPASEAEIALTSTALTSLIGILITGFFLSFGYHPVMMFVIAASIGVAAGSPYVLGSATSGPAAQPLPPPGVVPNPRSRRSAVRSWRMGDPETRAPRRYRGR